MTNPWTYVVGTIAIILLPGPNSLYVLSVAAHRGVRAGYRGAVGVWMGDAVLMILSACGVASLMHTYPPLFTVVKYAGAGYLAWVGIGLVVGAVRRLRQKESLTETVSSVEEKPDRPLARAFVISLLNPKAILFFVSFFIQFVDPAYPHPVVPFLILGLIVEIASVLYLTLLIFTGTYLARQFRERRKLSAGLTTGVGAVFVGFSVKLATATIG